MITDIVIVIAAALFMGVYVSWRAGWIDRLHTRVDMARAALDVTLLRRSSVALELATSGILDPATAAAGRSGARCSQGGAEGMGPPGQDTDRPRDLAESDLTRALRAAFSQPDFRASLIGKEGADELLAEVEAAAHQVFLARKFTTTWSRRPRRPGSARWPGSCAVRPGQGPRVLRDGRLPGRRGERRPARPVSPLPASPQADIRCW